MLVLAQLWALVTLMLAALFAVLVLAQWVVGSVSQQEPVLFWRRQAVPSRLTTPEAPPEARVGLLHGPGTSEDAA